MPTTMIAWPRRFAAEHPWLTVSTGCITFGVLMGSRTEFDHWWQRALIAGTAGAVLALTLQPYRHASSNRWSRRPTVTARR